MHKFDSQISYYLEKYRHGDAENAFHGLIDINRQAFPELVAAFRANENSDVRSFLLEIIWQSKDQSAVPILSDALFDPETDIWRTALDGLVALASPLALEALCAAKARSFPTKHETTEFRHWLEEAIEHATTELKRRSAQNSV